MKSKPGPLFLRWHEVPCLACRHPRGAHTGQWGDSWCSLKQIFGCTCGKYVSPIPEPVKEDA